MFRSLCRRPTRALFCASVLLCGALVLRFVFSASLGFGFLAWNLFLAWIPYLTGLGIVRLARRYRPGSGVLVLPTAFWLLFFPNAPYVITDLVHLRGAPFPHVVPDAALISAFAVLCLALGLVSLRTVHRVVTQRLGARAGWMFAATVLLLSGAGVWMGRVLRWNSWDVVTNPVGLLKTTLHALLMPWNHLPAVGFTLLFASVLFLLYVVAPRLRVGWLEAPVRARRE